jgi:hypothetical protein
MEGSFRQRKNAHDDFVIAKNVFGILTASGGGFNRSMQHTNHRVGARSVADETATKNLLLRYPEGANVGALEARLDAA